MDYIRVLESPFPTGHYILHEVNSNILVGRQVLVAVHGQKAKQKHYDTPPVFLLIDLLLALVLSSKALCCHLWVALWHVSLYHSKLEGDARDKNKDDYMALTKQILF